MALDRFVIEKEFANDFGRVGPVVHNDIPRCFSVLLSYHDKTGQVYWHIHQTLNKIKILFNVVGC